MAIVRKSERAINHFSGDSGIAPTGRRLDRMID